MDKEAQFIRIPIEPGARPQTMPTEPEKRLPSSDIHITMCDEADVDRISEGLYTCFDDAWWSKMEPPSMRPPLQSTRQSRLATRLRPSFSNPNMKWVKAVYRPTNTIVGIAGWMGPGNPVHNIWRRSATEFYGWDKACNWTEEDITEMWKGVDLDFWETKIAKADVIREEVMKGEPHWFLAPLFTFPEFQGRGVGKLLLDWAIDQADKTDPVTPLYLESAPYARAVYMHAGFVPVGEENFVRRGPKIVRGLEAEENQQGSKEKVGAEYVAKETEAALAS